VSVLRHEVTDSGHRQRIAGTFAGYLTLLAVAVIWSYLWNQDHGAKIDDFIKLASAWFAALTSALGAAVTLLVLSEQRSTATQLEQLKGEIAKGVKFAEMRVSRAGQAADAISAAMANFYYQYAALENNTFVQVDATKADRDMGVARARLSVIASESLSTLFHEFWQAGRNLQDRLTALGEAATPIERKELWSRHAKELGERMMTAERELRRSLDRSFARDGP